MSNNITETTPPAALKAAGRVRQLDALRGTAMILMTVFHALVDIRDFFGFADVRYYEPPLVFIGRSSAILFMFVSGVSCRFSKNNIKRGIKVLLCGMIVTLATYIAVPELYVRFGILHFLGSAMIIIGFFERLEMPERTKQFIMWIAVPLSLFAGWAFAGRSSDYPALLIFGITPAGFMSYDYYPLFPWIGVFFAGYAAGLVAINNREKLSAARSTRFARALGALGRHSLIYYLLHQPVLLALFFAFDALRRIALNL